jgi:hypothetical protein
MTEPPERLVPQTSVTTLIETLGAAAFASPLMPLTFKSAFKSVAGSSTLPLMPLSYASLAESRNGD